MMKDSEIINRVWNDFQKAYPGKGFFTIGQMMRFAKACLEMKELE